jgi:hypothetical protein
MIAQQKKQRNTSANIGSAVYSRRIALNSAAIVRVREFLAALWVKVRIEKPGWGSTAFLPTFIADKSRSSKTSGIEEITGNNKDSQEKNKRKKRIAGGIWSHHWLRAN